MLLNSFLKNTAYKIKKNFKNNFLDLHSPFFNKEDETEVKKTIKSTFVSTSGSKRQLFEKEIKLFTKSNYVLCLNSGTSAMHIGLKVIGIKKNDEVLIQSANYISNANCLLYLNAIPHFVDVNFLNLSLDIDKIEEYLKKICIVKKNLCLNKKTGRIIKALIVTHIFGHTCNIKKLYSVLKKFKIELVEDSAESLGSFFNEKHVGTFGRFGILSFNGNKIITTGAGGAILLKSKADYLMAKKYATICKKSHLWEYDYSDIGFNYLMPDLNASLGISQIKKIKLFLNKKIKILKVYKKIFTNNKIGHIYESINRKNNSKSNYWLQTLIISPQFKNKKNYIIKYMIKNGVRVRSLWKPLHLVEYLKASPKMDDLNGTLELYKRVISLPSSQHLL